MCYLCLVVLVCTQFCSTLSEGAVFPCSKKDTQFRNRTLWARMGGTVSLTFCAQSSVRVFERVNISHLNHRNGWYPQPAGVEETLEVLVIIHHHRSTVTINVNKLQPADIEEPFAVTLFAADKNGTRINDTSTFFFVIEETGSDTTVLTTPSAPLNTAVDNSSQFMTDLRHTTTGCVEQSNDRRRHVKCHVTHDICLTVFIGRRHLTPRDQCAAENAALVTDFKSIEILKPCLTDLLQLSPVKIVRLDETRYIDTRNWTEVPPQSPHRVPCLFAKQQLADPVITWFTLQPWDDQRETILWQHNLLDRNNTSVTIPGTSNTLNVTCQASGYPTPEVVILRDNEALEMSPDGMSLQLNHTFYGEFICRATNVLKAWPTQIRVEVSTAGKDTTVLTTPNASLNTAVDDTAQFMTDLRHTTTGCFDQSNGIYGQFMCHVIHGICVTVFVGRRHLTPMDQCAAENASQIAEFNNIEIPKHCLTDLLQLSPVKIVRLSETRYINIHNWTEVHPQSPHRVLCLFAKQQLADPVITRFTLQPWDDTRETILWQYNLLHRNNTFVTIPASSNTLNVTCQASGYPTPEVVILRDNDPLVMSPDGISLQLNHTFYGEFICRATNVLKAWPTQIRVEVSTAESLKKRGVVFDGSVRSVVLALELGLCLIMVATLFLFAFLCLRRQVNRQRTRRDDIQETVETPMIETQTGSGMRHGKNPPVNDFGHYSLQRPQRNRPREEAP